MVAVLASPVLCFPLNELPAVCRASRYELRFPVLFNAGRGYAFPCGANGNVDIDGLTDRSRANYFCARSTIGREFRVPVTCRIVDGSFE